jgi:hypothetical protein
VGHRQAVLDLRVGSRWILGSRPTLALRLLTLDAVTVAGLDRFLLGPVRLALRLVAAAVARVSGCLVASRATFICWCHRVMPHDGLDATV